MSMTFIVSMKNCLFFNCGWRKCVCITCATSESAQPILGAPDEPTFDSLPPKKKVRNVKESR
jgi:hypothetical protein